ncbi:MAG TPA: hypothetical protein VFF06_03690 [Polyangia bacterium]|nr:hypothetical protein [Polyangia bacterium]
MPLELTPLDALPPAVEKVAGAKAPAALKLMAARGLAPLGPADLLTAIYQLAQGDDATVKAAASKSATELPEKIFQGALGEPLDARVLDFFARRLWQKPKLLEILLLNKATDDETVRHLATLCAESELELIAKNEERLLRAPGIIAALYLNPKTRMSTAQRALELAVRNHVRVEGIPAFDEAVRAIEQSGALSAEEQAAVDAAFQRAAEVAVDAMAGLLTAASPEEEAAMQAAEALLAEQQASGEVPPESAEEIDEKKEKLEKLTPAAKIRMAQLGNAFTRAVLIRDTNRQVSMACIRSPGVTDAEAMRYAINRGLDDDVIRFIANKRQWVRLYGVKVALCNNPKCPLPVSMRFLPHLRPPDLKALSRSKGIPSALSSAAKQLLSSRGV